ncbi:hypothetical protein FB451DRAFT_1430832 [Mycena latifolia]|nr:hypothetical protein FB451DRAFT_1430832 [Mycena latifolia]
MEVMRSIVALLEVDLTPLEFRTLDEYASSISSSRSLVDWEMSLITDFSQLVISYGPDGFELLAGSRRFALVDVQSGKLVISHVESRAESSYNLYSMVRPSTWHYQPFINWFRSDWDLFTFSWPRRLLNSQGSMQEFLRSLTTLRRRSQSNMHGLMNGMTFRELLTSRGLVYRSTDPAPLRRLEQLPVAQLPEREITHPDSWSVVHSITSEQGYLGPEPWPESSCFPTVAREAEPGWTHFIVPLIGKTRNWISGFDALPHCGYFLHASIEFGAAVPDISAAWLAQSGSIISNLPGGYDESKPTTFYVT